jgi:murein DD-endopeptidase MepM/ murein hydrolase activator NlpD
MAFDPDLGRVAPSNVTLTVLDGWSQRATGLHPALDIPLAVGTPILAAADGVATRVVPTDSSDAGIFIALTHADGVVSRYLHLSQAQISQGQAVTKGQQIGLSGSTGLSGGPHLHFDLFVPQSLTAAVVQAVGKPSTGFFSDFGFGVGIPAEPWLPVDGYSASVVANAKTLGIPLFRDRPQTAVTVQETSHATRDFFVGVAALGTLVGLSWLALRFAKGAAMTLGRRRRYGRA